jgi:DNA-binding CsgD family transcriptional regulator
LPQNNHVLQSLTQMERQILKLISLGKTSPHIAEELNISLHTVNTHRKNICDKLHLEGSHALIKFAIQYQHLLS